MANDQAWQPAGSQPAQPVGPPFRHIHCSSRFDRSAESLERDLDQWMQDASVITLTEISNDHRAATMREKGWGNYNAKAGAGADNSGVCWDLEVWKCSYQESKKLHTTRWIWVERGFLATIYMHACTVLLVHKITGKKMLVSVCHMVNGVDGRSPGFSNRDNGWATRKKAYMEAVDTWSTYLKDQRRKRNVDAVMVVADWNINLKDTWFRSYLKEHWGKDYLHAWKRFPTEGGSLHGGPVAPLGAPGVSKGDRIIDGTLYSGLKVSVEPNLMARVSSSDHRPYREGFRFKGVGERDDEDEASGNTFVGEAWWGFGDYLVDEIYALETATGGVGGEVL